MCCRRRWRTCKFMLMFFGSVFFFFGRGLLDVLFFCTYQYIRVSLRDGRLFWWAVITYYLLPVCLPNETIKAPIRKEKKKRWGGNGGRSCPDLGEERRKSVIPRVF